MKRLQNFRVFPRMVWACFCFVLATTFFVFSGSKEVAAQASGVEVISVTDMLGRKVTLDHVAQRIVLAEGRHILTLGLLDKDPLARVVAWGNDLARYSPETFTALTQAFPRTTSMPIVGSLAGGSFSMESVIAAQPDLVIFTLCSPIPTDIQKLDNAGIPYVFVDFFQKPFEHTVPSMRLLGEALGRQDKAEAFITFYQHHMDTLTNRLQTTADRPAVFFHLHPDGENCCMSSGRDNMSNFIAVAGGHNIGVDKIPGANGQLSFEYVLARDPDFYLAAGGSTLVQKAFRIGTSIAKNEAEASMERMLAAPSVARLRAVHRHNYGGIWLFFFDSPLAFIGVEAMAKMFHPEMFSDVDPEQTLRVLNENFLAMPLKGTFWVRSAGQEP